jgi:hypothetical protein
MQPVHIVSSNIDAAAYQRGSLFLRFKSGVSYRYPNTPYKIYTSLIGAESPGSFFHHNVRAKYKYERLAYDPFNQKTVHQG